MKAFILERLRRSGPLLGLIVLSVALALTTPHFLTVNNILNVLRQVSINALIALGMTFVILTGGIDLSVGSMLALSGALAAGMIHGGVPAALAVALALFAGAAMGAANGVLVARGRLAPFIVTLATMTVYRGLTLVYTDGRPITGLGDAFGVIGRGYLFDLPLPVLWLGLGFAGSYLLLNSTVFGRHVYAVGGNEEAALHSGVATDRIKIWVYTISGLTAAAGGIILTSRLNSAQPTAGMGYELDAIAAVVLGGTSLSGGRGTLGGTLVGALIIGVLNNGLNLLNVSSFYQQVVKGAVILLAVLLDRSKAGR
ncbi:ribose ABC transporter permease [Hydrogenibacillus schlegelii]|uniref:Ribose ABC transporter permease n=1 Tax=Hydrogenibacillus schlegelii TaxID=1484 RepID=A0A132NA27_HYDSH|nr:MULTISPECIES: ribose ABC transporter permease [Hydrogenibacillus]KWX06392.1 ribose ABC transporter permease [Hydrogenibacillus schlegelii]OAR04480.1 ribose ABC transporter permease [Hydrogenibacillus schlegelii]QZA33255.1 ribose ABC transporter permease [Hydrogenibacillus sp. N12]